jgi:hypothetical protein
LKQLLLRIALCIASAEQQELNAYAQYYAINTLSHVILTLFSTIQAVYMTRVILAVGQEGLESSSTHAQHAATMFTYAASQFWLTCLRLC